MNALQSAVADENLINSTGDVSNPICETSIEHLGQMAIPKLVADGLEPDDIASTEIDQSLNVERADLDENEISNYIASLELRISQFEEATRDTVDNDDKFFAAVLAGKYFFNYN